MDKSLVCVVIGIGEKNGPIRWQGSDISSKAMILSCDEASLAVVMDTRLVVATVTISSMKEKVLEDHACTAMYMYTLSHCSLILLTSF